MIANKRKRRIIRTSDFYKLYALDQHFKDDKTVFEYYNAGFF